MEKFLIKFIVSFNCITVCLSLNIQGNSDEQVESEYAFQVGSIAIPEYIYNRELEKLSRIHGNLIPHSKKREWLYNWIDELKVINRAIEKGYSVLPKVQDAVRIMSRYMLVHSKNSPYARRVIDPLIKSEGLWNPDMETHELDRLRSRKLFGVKMQIKQQLHLEIDPIGESLVLKKLGILMNREEDPDIGEPSEFPLFTYSIGYGVEPQTTTIRDFFRKYKRKVVTNPIVDATSMQSEISDFLVNEFLYDQSIEMELDKDKRFVMEAENYLRNVVYESYLKRDLHRPTRTSLVEYYLANQEKYTQTTCVELWVAKSKDIASLASLRRTVLEMKAKYDDPDLFLSEFDEMSEKLGFELVLLKRNDENEMEAFYERAFVAPIGWVPPIERENENNSLVVKRMDAESGIPPFDSVRKTVENDLVSIEREKRKNNELKAIGDLYTVSFGKDYWSEPVLKPVN